MLFPGLSQPKEVRPQRHPHPFIRGSINQEVEGKPTLGPTVSGRIVLNLVVVDERPQMPLSLCIAEVERRGWGVEELAKLLLVGIR